MTTKNFCRLFTGCTIAAIIQADLSSVNVTDKSDLALPELLKSLGSASNRYDKSLLKQSGFWADPDEYLFPTDEHYVRHDAVEWGCEPEGCCDEPCEFTDASLVDYCVMAAPVTCRIWQKRHYTIDNAIVCRDPVQGEPGYRDGYQYWWRMSWLWRDRTYGSTMNPIWIRDMFFVNPGMTCHGLKIDVKPQGFDLGCNRRPGPGVVDLFLSDVSYDRINMFVGDQGSIVDFWIGLDTKASAFGPNNFCRFDLNPGYEPWIEFDIYHETWGRGDPHQATSANDYPAVNETRRRMLGEAGVDISGDPKPRTSDRKPKLRGPKEPYELVFVDQISNRIAD